MTTIALVAIGLIGIVHAEREIVEYQPGVWVFKQPTDWQKPIPQQYAEYRITVPDIVKCGELIPIRGQVPDNNGLLYFMVLSDDGKYWRNMSYSVRAGDTLNYMILPCGYKWTGATMYSIWYIPSYINVNGDKVDSAYLQINKFITVTG